MFDQFNNNNFAHSLTTVGALSNLRVAKTDSPDPVVAGQQVEYRIRIENQGPSVASNVRISDTLPNPAFISFVGYNIGNGTGVCFYQANTNEIDCNVGDIAVGSYREVFIRLLVAPNTPDGTVLNDTVSVLADSPIAFVPGSDFTESTTVQARADLVITKTSQPVVVFAGEQKVYTIRVENRGPSDAQNVFVTDTLPSSVQYEINTGLCANSGQVVTCSFGTIPVGGVRTFDIFTNVDPATLLNLTLNPAGTTITNVAVVGSSTIDPIPATNTASSQNFVRQKADLKVTKFGKKDGSVRAGEILTYTVIVDNLGPSYAYSVTLKDILQASGSFDVIDITTDRAATCRSVPPGGAALALPAVAFPPPLPPANGVNPPTGVAGVAERYQVDCILAAPLAVLSPAGGPPNPGRWILTMRVRATQAQSINNVAYVQSDIAQDPNTANNSAIVEHQITAVADLAISKSAVGNSVVAGCPPTFGNTANAVTAGRLLTYTITVTNTGFSDAENVVVIDRLPPGVTPVSLPTPVSPANLLLSCLTGTAGSAVDKLTCGLAIPSAVADTNQRPRLRPGQSATFTFVVQTSPSLAGGSILENDVSVSSGNFDDNLANNFASNLTTVSAFADLSISKSDNPATVVAGQLLNYTLTITNGGPSDAINVVVTDTLPAEVNFLSATGASCVQDPVNLRMLTCSLGNMPAGQVRVFSILVQVKPDAVFSGGSSGTITNLAGVRSDTPDPCQSNNAASEPTGILRQEGVFARKSDSPDPVLAGNELAYAITFGNNGPSTASNVTVQDTLGLGLTFSRCEGAAPNEDVVCQVTSGDGNLTPQVVRLISISRNNVVVWSSTFGGPLNDLDPGESYSFRLITRVESGYVLNFRGDTAVGQACRANFLASGYPHFAADRVQITSLLDSGASGDNIDDECTRVNGEADLSIDLSLGPVAASAFAAANGAAPGPLGWTMPAKATGSGRTGAATVNSGASAGTGALATSGTAPDSPVTADQLLQLSCAIVRPGGMLAFDITVTNRGPSDAAIVKVTNVLPQLGIAVDPDQVRVEFLQGGGQVLEVRDDGVIQLLLGNDTNNLGEEQLGRINAGRTVRVRLTLMVGVSAPCGSLLSNQAVLTLENGWVARLNGASVVPAVTTTSTGLFSSYLDPLTRRLAFRVDVTGLAGITSAHIHRGAAGVNGPVLYNLTSTPGSFTPATPITGTLQLTEADVADLLAGNLYVDIHTTAFPNGQVRGQILLQPATLDPVQTNNIDTESARVECPSIAVRKTVSFDGRCPGLSVQAVAKTAQAVTFCYEVTNNGSTFLDFVRITDTLTTRQMTMEIFTATIRAGRDPKFPIAPGETVTRSITVPAFTNVCGNVTNRALVSGIPTNSGRTAFGCLIPATGQGQASIFVPCGGTDLRLQLPVLNTDECTTWLQVQNLGVVETQAMVVIWGLPGACPPQSAGPLKIECTGLLKPGSAWTFDQPAPAQGGTLGHRLQLERHRLRHRLAR